MFSQEAVYCGVLALLFVIGMICMFAAPVYSGGSRGASIAAGVSMNVSCTFCWRHRTKWKSDLKLFRTNTSMGLIYNDAYLIQFYNIQIFRKLHYTLFIRQFLVATWPQNMENAVKMIWDRSRCHVLGSNLKGKKFWKLEFWNCDCRFGLLAKKECIIAKCASFLDFIIRTVKFSVKITILWTKSRFKLTLFLRLLHWIWLLIRISNKELYCHTF